MNDRDVTPHGWEVLVDLHGCDKAVIRSKERLQSFVVELCDLLHVKRYGDTIIQRFGTTGSTLGYSLV